MDFIKIPYRSMMRVWADDLASLIPVQWYPAPPGAAAMPYGTPFASRFADRTAPGALVLGEDPGTIQLGSGPPPRRATGLWFCGGQRMWEEGCSVLDPIPPRNVATGLPCCCGPIPFLATGGVALDGTGFVEGLAEVIFGGLGSDTGPALDQFATAGATAGGEGADNGLSPAQKTLAGVLGGSAGADTGAALDQQTAAGCVVAATGTDTGAAPRQATTAGLIGGALGLDTGAALDQLAQAGAIAGGTGLDTGAAVDQLAQAGAIAGGSGVDTGAAFAQKATGGAVAGGTGVDTGPAAGGSMVYSVAGSFTFTVPAGVTTLTGECIGAGGGGNNFSGGAGGPGGGAYAKATWTVAPGDSVAVVVGASASYATGQDSTLTHAATLRVSAAGGLSPGTSAGALGGAAASCTGSTKFSGGQGGNGNGTTTGGGGGSSAGTASAGNYTTSTTTATGATAPTGGGGGGAGGVGAGTPGAGVSPGGACGGTGNSFGPLGASSAGWARISW